MENVPMDFCGLMIQPEDLGLQAPHLKKIHSAHTLHLKASPVLGISEQNNRFFKINFNKVNKSNKKIKMSFQKHNSSQFKLEEKYYVIFS